MLYTPLHNKWLRLITASVGTALMAVGLNLFIVPLHLYPGGLMGVCQLLRTLFLSELGVSFGTMDIAGVLYLLLNRLTTLQTTAMPTTTSLLLQKLL